MAEEKQFLLTIITTTYNAEATIAKTIESVLQQEKYSDDLKLEYVFVDAKSKDETVHLIEHYLPALHEKGIQTQLISEPDRGIYDGMNKGIKLAHGRWIQLLNAGDVFYQPDVLAGLEEYMKHSDAEILYGDFCRRNAYIEEVVKPGELDVLRKDMILCHQSLLVRDTLYARKLYDLENRFCADYKFLLDAYLNQVKFQYIPICMVYYDLEGVSAECMLKTYMDLYSVRKSLNVVEPGMKEHVRFAVGCTKRRILASLPEGFRWKLYHIVKGRTS